MYSCRGDSDLSEVMKLLPPKSTSLICALRVKEEAKAHRCTSWKRMFSGLRSQWTMLCE